MLLKNNERCKVERSYEKGDQGLENNDTWTLETLLLGKKAIGCKWVYKTKFTLDGMHRGAT